MAECNNAIKGLDSDLKLARGNIEKKEEARDKKGEKTKTPSNDKLQDLNAELKKVKDINRKLLSRLETAEENITSAASMSDKLSNIQEELDKKKKELKRTQNELNKEKENVKNHLKESDNKSKKIVDLENSYTRMKLMLEQAKEASNRKNEREVRFEETPPKEYSSRKRNSSTSRRSPVSQNNSSPHKSYTKENAERERRNSSSRRSPASQSGNSPFKNDDKCQYEDKGKCRNGTNCNYRHPTTTCSSYSKLGYCYAGRECESRHPESSCRSWKRNRSCSKGDQCYYRHPIKESTAKKDELQDPFLGGTGRRNSQESHRERSGRDRDSSKTQNGRRSHQQSCLSHQ